jgi:tripartite-type tricarboxylate transporter receptor subunit TctC
MFGKGTLLLAILLLACAPGAAEAQSYPNRPIKMIVPFPPGGPVDVSARILGQHLPRTLGQAVVIENRAGAAGSLGARAVANADPDGYSLLCGNISTLVVLPAVTNNRDYDPSKVFSPVAKISHRPRNRSPSSSPTPGRIPASSTTARPGTAMRRTSRPNFSSCGPASISCTSLIKAPPRP